MGQANVIVNGRSYPLHCADGDEPRLELLAEHVRAKVDALVGEFGQVGDERLLVLASLLIADELFDLRERVASAEREDSRVQPAAAPSQATAQPVAQAGGPPSGHGTAQAAAPAKPQGEAAMPLVVGRAAPPGREPSAA